MVIVRDEARRTATLGGFFALSGLSSRAFSFPLEDDLAVGRADTDRYVVDST